MKYRIVQGMLKGLRGESLYYKRWL